MRESSARPVCTMPPRRLKSKLVRSSSSQKPVRNESSLRPNSQGSRRLSRKRLPRKLPRAKTEAVRPRPPRLRRVSSTLPRRRSCSDQPTPQDQLVRGASCTLTTTSRRRSRPGSSSEICTRSKIPRLDSRRWLSSTRSNEKGSPGRSSISRSTVTSRVRSSPASTTCSTTVRRPGSTTRLTLASSFASENTTSLVTWTSRCPVRRHADSSASRLLATSATR